MLFHATRKALARKIRNKGFSISKMKAGSRFGKGTYLSRSPKTAMRERKAADALLQVKVRKGLKQNSLNMTRPTPKKLRSLIRVPDMRGATKKGIIGPKLGHKLGRYAGKTSRPIRYRSAKNAEGVNYFIPRKLSKKHPRVIQGVQMKSGGRYH